MKVEKKRYFYVKLQGLIPSKQQFIAELRKHIQYLAGEIGVAQTNFHVFQYEQQSAFIRTTLETKDLVEVALIMCGLQTNYYLKIIRISGTIKSLKSKLR